MKRVLAGLTVLVLAGCTAPQEQQPPSTADVHSTHTFSVAPPKPLRAGERFTELKMERAFTPQPDRGTDEYRCFLVDPGFAQRTFVTGSQVLPQNPALVHHAIFFRVAPDDVAQARELDGEDDGDGWTCFGGTGIGRGDPRTRGLASGAAWIAAWAPGGDEIVLANDIGYEMPAGSQIVMQIHYNLLGAQGKAGTDQSGIRLRLNDGGSSMRPLQTTLLVAPVELPCTATESGNLCNRDSALIDVWSRFGNQSGTTIGGLLLLCSGGKPKPGPVQSCDHKAREAGVIQAAAGHMHLLGRSIKVELHPGTPKAKVLLDVPVYDFDDQGARPLAEPVTVKAGDIVRVTCTHDASLRQQLPALRGLEPRYVVWGEGTSDEMCLGILSWTRT